MNNTILTDVLFYNMRTVIENDGNLVPIESNYDIPFPIKNLPKYRLCVDEEIDLKLIRKIYEHFHPNIYFNWKQIINFAAKNKKLFKINSELKLNEGYKMDKGQKLWKRATAIILGGNSLLSKNPNLFLPNKWPTYFSKSKGCKVWDLNNHCYTDMSLMGVGTNILGYCNNEVDNAIALFKEAVSIDPYYQEAKSNLKSSEVQVSGGLLFASALNLNDKKEKQFTFH